MTTKETIVAKIMVVDDEPDVTALLAYHLKAAGHTVQALNDPTRAVPVAKEFQPELMILDVMMPDLSGLEICRSIRADAKLKDVPVIFLTARTEENDRISGLESGADDYVCKPFSTKELMLRVQSILRRRKAGVDGTAGKLLEAGQILLDPVRHEVKLGGRPLSLTATEFKLLQILMERRGRVQTREKLLVDVWNYEAEIETRTVDTHMRRLREKLGDEAAWVETIRGVGYRMSDRRS
jgi:two-component system phosphate regulon response regulator PhoB